MSDYNLLEWSELVANFSVIGGVVVVIGTIINFRTSVQYGRAQLFLSLRENFARVHNLLERDLPGFADGAYRQSYDELPDEAKSAVTLYWTNAFNEWCATTKIYKSGRGILWQTFYANAQASALLHRPLREGLLDLMAGPYSFGGFKREYQRVMRGCARRLLAGRAGVPVNEAQRRDVTDFMSALDAIKLTR